MTTSASQMPGSTPELRTGDHLTRDEFERRWEAMPWLKKAELVEGVVYVTASVSRRHGWPDLQLATWLGNYVAGTPGVEAYTNTSVRLDPTNEPQPDSQLRILPAHGGQSRDDGEYITGAPELAAEVAASSASYDLHQKLGAYQRNGVREYLVWRVMDAELDWFVLRDGGYVRHVPSQDGVLRSEVFPGLWLDVAALLEGDLKRVLEILDAGLATAEHAAFVARLARAGG